MGLLAEFRWILSGPTLASIGSAIGPIGNSSSIPTITIDSKGRVTALTSTPIVFHFYTIRTGWRRSRWILSKSNINFGRYCRNIWDSTHYPIITTDVNGRVINATLQVIPQQFTAGGDLSGTYLHQNVVGIQGNPVSPPDGYFTSLIWNGSSLNWISEGGPPLGMGYRAIPILIGMLLG